MTVSQPKMNTLDLVAHGPVIPVIVIDRLQDAVPLAEALVAGGVRVLEVTLRTPVALDAIRAMSAVPGAIVSAARVGGGSAGAVTVISDDSGHFVFAALLPGDYVVTATAGPGRFSPRREARTRSPSTSWRGGRAR